MNQKAKRKSPIAVIASISVIILIAILGSVYYKLNVAQSTLVEEPVPPVEQENEEFVEDIVETDVEPDQPKEDEVGTSNGPSGEKPIEPPPSATKQPEPTLSPNVEVEQEKIENGYVIGQQAPTEPTVINGVLIANKKHPLPASYNKGEDPNARAAFEKMSAAAKAEGIELVAFSGYRSYEYQKTLYDRYVGRDGKDAADRYSARPGHSEHQTGLAFDIGEKGREELWLTSAFGETKAGQWLAQNSYKYGFILRYPKGKESITGFMHESWHFRYLEGDLATKVYESGVTLEEYLGIQ